MTVRTLTLAALLQFVAAGCTVQPTPAGPPPPAPKAIPNFAEVSPTLFRGGQPDAEGYRQLAAMGVKTAISFRYFHDGREDAEAAGLEFVRLPIHASITSSPPSEEQVQEFFDIVLDPARQPVFIHCKHGSDRTGTMAALYRMECQGWEAPRAIREMQDLGYHDYYRDLIGYVEDYAPRGYGAR